MAFMSKLINRKIKLKKKKNVQVIYLFILMYMLGIEQSSKLKNKKNIFSDTKNYLKETSFLSPSFSLTS